MIFRKRASSILAHHMPCAHSTPSERPHKTQSPKLGYSRPPKQTTGIDITPKSHNLKHSLCFL